MNEILNFEGPVAAHRLGQREGFVAGVIVSVGVYYLFKAYRPSLTRWSKKEEDNT